MVSIQYISDIHLEFIQNTQIILDKIIKTSDICVLAGDIGYPFENHYEEFLIGISKKFKHIILIHGNHEYYQLGKNKGKTMKQIINKTIEIININNLDNIYFLNNSYIDIDNIRFIGSTLWSLIKNPLFLINDSKYIEEFNVEYFNNLYNSNVEILSNHIEKAKLDNKQVVIVTHHLPSYECIASKYKHYDINQCFASNSDNLINSPVILWIFGHTHSPIEKLINKVKCIANPIGYPGELINPDFNKIIELEIS